MQCLWFFDEEEDDDDLLQLPEVLCLSDKSSGLISDVLDCIVPIASHHKTIMLIIILYF